MIGRTNNARIVIASTQGLQPDSGGAAAGDAAGPLVASVVCDFSGDLGDSFGAALSSFAASAVDFGAASAGGAALAAGAAAFSDDFPAVVFPAVVASLFAA